jgi:hypothetical protein
MQPAEAPANTCLSWKAKALFPVSVFVVARVALSALGLALLAVGQVPTNPLPFFRPYFDVAPVTEGIRGALLGIWQRFDAIHYLRIASGGYSSTDLSAYFPLYPVLVRIAGSPLRHDLLLASILLSNGAAALGLVVFYGLVIDETRDQQVARRATIYLLFFPTAFFFIAPYPESLFLLLTVLTFREVRREHWLRAGTAALACSLVRPQGALLMLAFLAEAVSRYRSGARPSLPHVLAGIAPLVGVAGFIAWRSAVGYPPLSAVLLAYWQRVTTFPFYAVFATTRRIVMGAAQPIEFLDLAVVSAMVALGVLVIRRLPLSFGAYYWGALVFNLSQTRIPQPISSQARYALTLFPAFIVLGQLGSSPRVHRLILYPSFALWLFLAGQFIMWGWVG